MENKKYILSMFIISLFIISTLNNIFSCSLFNADTYNRENDKLDNISLNKLDYTISIPEININDNNIKGEIYSQIEIPECGFLAEVGKPKIPFLTLKYLLPYGNDIKDINVKGGESVKLEGSYKLEPAQESMLIGLDTIQEYKIDKKIYSSGEQFPNKFYEEIGTYKFRGYCILVINIYPISYIPKTGELSYYKTMDIQLSLSQNNKINSFFRGVEKDEKSVLDIIDNPNILQSYNIKDNKINNLKTSYLNPNSYDYLIITNEALLNSQGMYTFQDLANRKIENGYKTTIITVEEIYASYPGRDHQEMIRNCIIDAYQTWGIEYVLLGGDGDGSNVGEESNDPIIPARGLYAISELRFDYNIPSDLYYAALDGTWNDDNDPFWGEPGEDDLFAEVYIGRAPVDSEEELSNFVYKTLFHEDDTDSYLSKVLMVGEDLGWTSWGGDKMDELINGSDSHGFRTVGFPDTYNVDTLYDRDDPSHDWEISELTTIIKNGVHIINHLGHSNVDYNMKMRNDDIDNLTNTHFFFLYSQGCYNGAFDNRGTNVFHYYSYDCIAEHMTTTAKGAFAVIANSRYGYGDSIGTDGASQYYNRQFYDAIFGENIMEIGRANHDSKLDNIGYINKDSMRWIYYDLNLFGDPSATIHPQPNHNEPTLTTPNVSPLIKDQKTE